MKTIDLRCMDYLHVISSFGQFMNDNRGYMEDMVAITGKDLKVKAIVLDMINMIDLLYSIGYMTDPVEPRIVFWMPSEIHYYLNGKKYRKIGRLEKIAEGACHSWCAGELQPVQNPETIGDIPARFSDERDFYNPIPE